MLQRLDLRGFTGDLAAALARPDAPDAAPLESVREIIGMVREHGDRAVRELTERFDGCAIEELRVEESELRAALDAATPEFRAALEYARDEITAYHRAQRAPEIDCVRGGIRIRELVLPVERAGCYVPGGRANYPSTVLMTAIPALVAGVGEIVL